MVNVTHISYSPLAGAPIRIVDALNNYTDFHSRLINLNPFAYNKRSFPEDLIWRNDKELCIELISNSDILHFHHYMDFESENNAFGINFRKLAPKAKFLRHYHSDINHICYHNNVTKQTILNDPFPRIVIPHYPERDFLDTFIVPNIIPIHSDLYKPSNTNLNSNSKVELFYSTSILTSLTEERWATKGYPEIKEKLEELSNILDFNYSIISNTPYEQCLQLKKKSSMVIGDIITGSYHLTDLESLAMGKPTFSYLDGRTQLVLQNLLKCDDLPFINTQLEDLYMPLKELVSNKELRQELGEFSRYWIEKYYNDKILVKFYIQVYNNLLNDLPIKRQNELKFTNAKKFLYNDLYNLKWQTKSEKYKTAKYEKIKLSIKKAINKKKKIVFWGASLFLIDLLKNMPELASNISGIIDINPDNCNKNFYGLKIYPPKSLQHLKPEIVISTVKNNHDKIYPEIKKYIQINHPNIEMHADLF